MKKLHLNKFSEKSNSKDLMNMTSSKKYFLSDQTSSIEKIKDISNKELFKPEKEEMKVEEKEPERNKNSNVDEEEILSPITNKRLIIKKEKGKPNSILKLKKMENVSTYLLEKPNVKIQDLNKAEITGADAYHTNSNRISNATDKMSEEKNTILSKNVLYASNNLISSSKVESSEVSSSRSDRRNKASLIKNNKDEGFDSSSCSDRNSDTVKIDGSLNPDTGTLYNFHNAKMDSKSLNKTQNQGLLVENYIKSSVESNKNDILNKEKRVHRWSTDKNIDLLVPNENPLKKFSQKIRSNNRETVNHNLLNNLSKLQYKKVENTNHLNYIDSLTNKNRNTLTHYNNNKLNHNNLTNDKYYKNSTLPVNLAESNVEKEIAPRQKLSQNIQLNIIDTENNNLEHQSYTENIRRKTHSNSLIQVNKLNLHFQGNNLNNNTQVNTNNKKSNAKSTPHNRIKEEELNIAGNTIISKSDTESSIDYKDTNKRLGAQRNTNNLNRNINLMKKFSTNRVKSNMKSPSKYNTSEKKLKLNYLENSNIFTVINNNTRVSASSVKNLVKPHLNYNYNNLGLNSKAQGGKIAKKASRRQNRNFSQKNFSGSQAENSTPKNLNINLSNLPSQLGAPKESVNQSNINILDYSMALSRRDLEENVIKIIITDDSIMIRTTMINLVKKILLNKIIIKSSQNNNVITNVSTVNTPAIVQSPSGKYPILSYFNNNEVKSINKNSYRDSRTQRDSNNSNILTPTENLKKEREVASKDKIEKLENKEPTRKNSHFLNISTFNTGNVNNTLNKHHPMTSMKAKGRSNQSIVNNVLMNIFNDSKDNDSYPVVEIIECSDGIETLKSVIEDQGKNQVKLIFTDENMEFMSGSDSARIISKMTKDKKN